MKTTNFEISKKLYELGFRTSYKVEKIGLEEEIISITNIVDASLDKNELDRLVNNAPFYPSFYLETILEALPKQGLYMEFGLTGNQFLIKLCQFIVLNKEGESLADTAARLLILLIEKGLVEVGGNDA